ncbi:MAG: TlpA family protein disulfide reductase, partial [Planctomycetota bacterium]
MRTLLAGIVVLLLVAAWNVRGLRADDATDPGSPDGAAEPAFDPGRFWYAKLLTPTEAWARLNEKVRGLPYAQRRAVTATLAREYLAAWEATRSGERTPEEISAVYPLFRVAGRASEIVPLLRAVVGSEDAEDSVRERAAAQLAGLLSYEAVRTAEGEKGLALLAGELETALAAIPATDLNTVRAGAHTALARYYAREDEEEKATEHYLAAARCDPAQTGTAARSLLRSMMSSTWRLAEYPALRERAKKVFGELREQGEKYVALAEAREDARQKERAEATLRRIEKAEAILSLLGEPAPAWTLEHAFGDVKSLEELKGKVVVLDFWATWCPWCIKSFPALRDVLRDYEGQDLALVGVTASASTVYASRYDLDDDLKAKGEGQGRPKPAAMLDRGRPAADSSIPVLPEAEYRAKEKEVLASFIQNHEMTWPVVMIDKEGPAG